MYLCQNMLLKERDICRLFEILKGVTHEGLSKKIKH